MFGLKREFQLRIIELFKNIFFIPLCPEGNLDAFGDHAASCPRKGDLIATHNGVVAVLLEHCRLAGWTVTTEERWLLNNNQKPADILVYLLAGIDTAIDVIVGSPWNIASTTPGFKQEHLFAHLESIKRNEYLPKCTARGLGFIPFAVGSLGGFGPAAMKFINAIARAQAGAKPSTIPSIVQTIMYDLSASVLKSHTNAWLRRGHACALLGTNNMCRS